MDLGRFTTTSRTGQQRVNLEDEFYCRPRRRRLTFEKCLEDYVTANAFETRRSSCWRCPQGCQNRNAYAADI